MTQVYSSLSAQAHLGIQARFAAELPYGIGRQLGHLVAIRAGREDSALTPADAVVALQTIAKLATIAVELTQQDAAAFAEEIAYQVSVHS